MTIRALTPGSLRASGGRSYPRANSTDMLLQLLAAALVCALAFYVIAQASVRIIRALGMDPVVVMLWLGLAEEPVAVRRADRRRLHELLVEQR